ncbi:MAG: cytochrome b [Alcanivorax sp.]|nr:cytochrome b [Alcanivorax sp.]
MKQSDATGWHPLSKGLHWLIALLLVAVWGSIELHEFYSKGDPMREWWKMLHFSLGLTVLMLMLIRFYWRATHPRPAPLGAPWQQRLSGLIHGLLYLVVIGMPLGGFSVRQFAGKPIEVYGLFTVPQLTPVNHDLAEAIEFLHTEVFWYLLLGLLGLHVAGGLWHHFVDRDSTLKRMLPGG